MLNKKFASIRATANVKTENKRSSIASSVASHQQQQQSQRLTQSQSMEMFNSGANYQANNEILMNMRSSPSLYDQRTTSSPITNTSQQQSTHLRGAMMKTSPHPYVNLLHHQYAAQSPQQQQHLQYQNQHHGSSVSFGSPILLDTSNNQSWNSSYNNSNTASPLATHYTASQIYMRPKSFLQQPPTAASNSSSPIIAHKKPPPDIPRRISSSNSNVSKRPNGLSRSSKYIIKNKI